MKASLEKTETITKLLFKYGIVGCVFYVFCLILIVLLLTLVRYGHPDTKHLFNPFPQLWVVLHLNSNQFDWNLHFQLPINELNPIQITVESRYFHWILRHSNIRPFLVFRLYGNNCTISNIFYRNLWSSWSVYRPFLFIDHSGRAFGYCWERSSCQNDVTRSHCDS